MENEKQDFAGLDERHQLIKESVALCFGGTNTDVGLAYRKLSDLHYADDKYLSVMHKTLTTGSETGKKFALANARDIVYPPHKIYDGDTARSLRDTLLRVWCVGNVVEATGHTDAASLLEESKEALYALVDEGMGQYHASRDETFWHGLVVLIKIVDAIDQQSAAASGRFIPWAGSRNDWSDIIRVGRDRSSTDPALIESILLEEVSVDAPLRSGVL